MHHFFTPNHVQLLNACYPPSSALLSAVQNPNSHELSRLTYYASNNRGKLTKLGLELEKRLRTECRKACNGNLRMKASLLITLSIFRSLALECKRDIALLSPFLVNSVEITLTSLASDLGVVVRAASVFTAWTTFTDGHPIGADSALTANYLSALRSFASLSGSNSSDNEIRNRTRLVGLSALTAALNSEALYNDFIQFRAQVAIILDPIILILLHSEVSVLDEQAVDVKDRVPVSPSLAEFRQRPTYERRAASIHLHVDGDRGPSDNQVSDAALRALFSLLNHANSPQLGFIMQSTFDSLDQHLGWSKTDHCCWLAQRIADWAQYQYRYVVPTWLVERLMENQNSTATIPMLQTLTAMITTVLDSPTRMINLSSSDILSNLTTVLVRRTSIHSIDPLIPLLERCIASLGTHVYYSDQIQDLAGELIGRLITAEIQGVLAQGKPGYSRSRSSAIQAILAGLSGLIETANRSDAFAQHRSPSRSNSPMADRSSRDPGQDGRVPRRTRVPPDIWQDTLSLICDREVAVRQNYTNTLVYYISHEMPKYGDSPDPDGTRRARKLAEGPLLQAVKASAFLHPGDVINKFLNALHAYYFMLLTCSVLGLTSTSSPDTSSPAFGDFPTTHNPVHEETLNDHSGFDRRTSISPSQITGRPSFSLSQGPRDRKISLVHRYVKRAQNCLSSHPAASFKDIQDALKVLQTVQEQVPTRGLLAGVPMLLALQRALKSSDENPGLLRWIFAVDELLARVWLSIGTVWNVPEVVQMAAQALGSMKISFITAQPSLSDDAFLTLQDFSWNQGVRWSPVVGEAALGALISNEGVFSAFGVDQQALSHRLSTSWTPEGALNDFDRLSGFEATVRGDGISPLLRISPALMQMNNISLQSLARSTRGLGVTDLREALEGRSSMSNPTLVRPPSISTLDHAPSLVSGENGLRLAQSRSRTRSKKRTTPSAAGEVRDVLSKLGIGKQNGNLLKASFSALQKSSDQRLQHS